MRIEDLDDEYFSPNLWEMANFPSKFTGLEDGVKLWIRPEVVILPHNKYRFKLFHKQKGSAVFAIWGNKIQQVEGDWKISGKDLTYLNKFAILTINDMIKFINDDDEFDISMLIDSFKEAKKKLGK